MNKTTVIISSPVDTYSGYGARSRDFISALIKERPEWDVRLLSQRWGNTRFNYLKDHNDTELGKLVIQGVKQKPDVWIQITVPNEFQRIGSFNIGVTAGIETTVCDPSWLEGVNRMDLTLTSANHGKTVFSANTFDKMNDQKQKVGEVKLQKPIEVLFEGVKLDKYKRVALSSTSELVSTLDSIKESFCFLAVGHWLQGDFKQDRKNIGGTIERFLVAFKNKHVKPALILKTQAANSSIMDKSNILKKIDDIRKAVGKENLPNIYLLHGELSDEEVNMLYNHSKVKAMVSLTKGEGFGRPLLEFTTTGKPIIASAWSGHTDFLRQDLNLLVGGKLEDVHSSATIKNMILDSSKWFTPDENQSVTAYREVYKHYKKAVLNGKKQAAVTKKYFSFDAMQAELGSILTKYTPKFVKQVDLKLPQPKSIGLTNKIKLG
jgi:hypothetical protein